MDWNALDANSRPAVRRSRLVWSRWCAPVHSSAVEPRPSVAESSGDLFLRNVYNLWVRGNFVSWQQCWAANYMVLACRSTVVGASPRQASLMGTEQAPHLVSAFGPSLISLNC